MHARPVAGDVKNLVKKLCMYLLTEHIIRIHTISPFSQICIFIVYTQIIRALFLKNLHFETCFQKFAFLGKWTAKTQKKFSIFS